MNKAFQNWFRHSVVVDPLGNPRVMYHGTARTAIRQFSGHRGVAGHFAFLPELANEWAITRHETEQGLLASGAPDFGDAAVIYPVYLCVEKPFDARDPDHLHAIGIGAIYDYQDLEPLVSRIQQAGFDGYYDFEHNLKEATGIAVFWPWQIKSAIGNSGAFDPKNPDICDSACTRVAQQVRARRPSIEKELSL